MVRTPRVVKALFAILLVSAPAGAMLSTYAPTAPRFEFLASAPGDGFGGEVVQEFSASFEEVPATGTLDLRIDQGAIRVIGWDEPGYLVQVLQARGADPLVGERSLDVVFADETTDGHLDLSIAVDQHGGRGLDAQLAPGSGHGRIGTGGLDTAIVAYVPASTEYDTVFICSGQIEHFALVWPLGGGAPADGDCLPSDARSGTLVAASLDESQRLDVILGIENLHGGHATLLAEYIDPELIDVEFDSVDVVSGHEDVVGSNARIGTLRAEVVYGDVVYQGVLDNAEILARYGNVGLTLLPESSGILSVVVEHGDLTVELPRGGETAYDIQATAEHGEVEVVLEGVEVSTVAAGEDRSNGEVVDAHTPGFEDLPVQVVMTLTARYGDILVTDGSIPTHAHEAESEEDEQDEEPDGNETTGSAMPLPVIPRVEVPALPRLPVGLRL